VQGTLLRSGNTRSCGCFAKEVKSTKRKPDNGGELTAVILGYKRHAARRGLSWNLGREYVRAIISKPCLYCGSIASNEKRTKNTKEPFKYNGIDRYDNAVGYEESNVVPCCFVCNRAKGDLSATEFLEWVNKVEAMAEQWGKAPTQN
jgi:5-methylcytosine-specific restriction endonuclease McrA